MSNWVVQFASNDKAAFRLFCFHYAGGSANVFRSWRGLLPSNVEILSIELPGHGGRLSEALVEDLFTLVSGAAQAIVPLLDRPFAFFGHSMGALLSFELAHLLRRFAMPMPCHLFISAHSAPHLARTKEPLHGLPESEFVEKIKQLNGTPQEVFAHPELLQLFLPILRNDMKLCETYTLKQRLPLNSPMTIYGGRDDQDVDPSSLQAWSEHTFAATTFRLIEGDHFFIHQRRDQFLEIFRRDLEDVLAGQGV